MIAKAKIVVADDEANARRMLEILLGKLGCEVVPVANGRLALDWLRNNPADLLVTDLNMPEMDGLALLRSLREEGNELPVIVVSAYGTVENAVAAMKQGAADFIIRPLDVGQVEMVIRRTLSLKRTREENEFLRDEMDKGWGEFIGGSAIMQEVYRMIAQAGPSRASTFIVGETGTGKELVARAIHRKSGRRGLFVPVNCAAIPADIMESELFGYVRGAFTGAHKDKPGKFELADNGTLFLDEITEMQIGLQAKLLRALQEGRIDRLGGGTSIPVDIRIIAATNRQPREAVNDGRLRQDLYYRLNVLDIRLPPLRERRDDILPLARHFLSRFGAQQGAAVTMTLSPDAERALLDYAWPGNVRELQNMMERAAVLARNGVVSAAYLSRDLQTAAESQAPAADEPEELDLEARVAALELQLIHKALAMAGGNKAKAARILNISERSLWYKLKKYGLGQ